ncbi:MAG: precorrin-6Y C5,15-methyltransferase (decarboxylating) subunit CbiT, partial [Paramuribaculum sp.]|nr:precorrin-6Y C5,15-methyltransferase (decarboxylating) subunit CbiT [Paramuribaculum sp.]
LTDRIRTPRIIAQKMLEYGYSNYLMTIGENLGNKHNESVRTLTLQEAATTDFQPLNCIILTRQQERPKPFGIPDNLFDHLSGRENMITKMPIRLLVLSMLEIHNSKSLWDIGFCTGSVSIEAKLQAPHLTINSFEIRNESESLFKSNTRRFGTPGIDCHIGDFLNTDISAIPAPDTVFIGGHGGKLHEIITKIKQVLQPGGIIVFNSVSTDSLELFEKSIQMHGMKITRRHTMLLDKHNPITVMQAK